MFDGPLASSPASIAASVSPPRGFRAAEAKLAELRERYDAAGDAIRVANGMRTDRSPDTAEIAVHEAERAALRKQIDPLRAQVAEQIVEHGSRVRAALAPAIATAARAHGIATDLRAALAEFEAINRELDRARAERVLLIDPDLEPLLSRLSRLAQ